jgi:hypothetical protein
MMKKAVKKKEIISVEAWDNASQIQIWWTIPKFIEWLRDHRTDPVASRSVEYTIVILSTTLIEGFLFDLIAEEIMVPAKIKKLEDRLIVDMNKRLANASWLNYIELFKLATGIDLNKLTSNDTWKGINILFQLRNLLIHGNVIEVVYYTKKLNEPVYNSKYKHIYNYLLELKIIQDRFIKLKPNDLNIFKEEPDLLSKEAIDHFWTLTNSLINDIYNNYVKSELQFTSDSYLRAFKEDFEYGL